MPKNIVIFSDGTGQGSGYRFDENRSNIYKLYRATRVAPDSSIDPKEQVAFYDPGLGSQGDGSNLWGQGILRWFYNLVSQATGFGITANIIDCYAAIIRLYEEGDRIFLFGFSRGAYTVRCLAGVIVHCGIPRNLPNNQPLKLDVASSHELASYAVKHIYQFTETRSDANSYQHFLLKTRDELAKRFRRQHGSQGLTEEKPANVYPYFIGVFDTVAALGNWKKSGLFAALFVIGAYIVSFVASYLYLVFEPEFLKALALWPVFFYIIGSTALTTLIIFLYTHIKFDFQLPEYSLFDKLQTFHLTAIWQTFYDTTLNKNVLYAKHAISIDENRADFKRVEWGAFDLSTRKARDELNNPWFEQVWFPGCHSDVGGSYPENEARLSDGSLKWMLACASVIPESLKHDQTVLQTNPDGKGMQHDERKAGLGFITRRFHITWNRKDRPLPLDHGGPFSKAPMHKSVYDRFDAGPVIQYDSRYDYRPETLRNHVDFKDAYTSDGTIRARANKTRDNAAVDTENKFDKALKTKAKKTSGTRRKNSMGQKLKK